MKMKLIAISGYLGVREYLSPLKKVIQDEEPDGLVFTGGMARGKESLKEFEKPEEDRSKKKMKEELEGKRKDIEAFMKFLRSLNIPCFVIPGRTDSPTNLYDELTGDAFDEDPDLHSIHLRFVQKSRLLFSGCGGLVSTEEEDYFSHNVHPDRMTDKMNNLKSFGQDIILLFHTPPKSALEEEPAEGNEEVEDLIEELKPKLVFYGMVYPEKKMKVVDDVVMINPGPLSEGHYGIVDTASMKVDFKDLEEM